MSQVQVDYGMENPDGVWTCKADHFLEPSFTLENKGIMIVTIIGAMRCLIWKVGKPYDLFIFVVIQVVSIIGSSKGLFLDIVGAYAINVGLFLAPMSLIMWRFFGERSCLQLLYFPFIWCSQLF